MMKTQEEINTSQEREEGGTGDHSVKNRQKKNPSFKKALQNSSPPPPPPLPHCSCCFVLSLLAAVFLFLVPFLFLLSFTFFCHCHCAQPNRFRALRFGARVFLLAFLNIQKRGLSLGFGVLSIQPK